MPVSETLILAALLLIALLGVVLGVASLRRKAQREEDRANRDLAARRAAEFEAEAARRAEAEARALEAQATMVVAEAKALEDARLKAEFEAKTLEEQRLKLEAETRALAAQSRARVAQRVEEAQGRGAAKKAEDSKKAKSLAAETLAKAEELARAEEQALKDAAQKAKDAEDAKAKIDPLYLLDFDEAFKEDFNLSFEDEEDPEFAQGETEIDSKLTGDAPPFRQRPALWLQRSALPVPTSDTGWTHLGGLPRLPKDKTWPRSPQGKPLSFAAQIRFEDLPPCGDLPKTGVMWLFLDTAFAQAEKGKSQGRILFARKGPAEDETWNLAPAPEDLPKLCQGLESRGFWLSDNEAWSRVGFKLPLKGKSFSSVEADGCYYHRTADEETLLADDEVKDVQIALDLKARKKADRGAASRYGTQKAQAALDRVETYLNGPDWPRAGVFAEEALRLFAHRLATDPSLKRLQDFEKLSSQVNLLINDASSDTMRFEVLPEAEREAFRSFFKAQGVGKGRLTDSERLDAFAHAALIVAAEAPDQVKTLLCDEVRDWFALTERHQILGYGDVIDQAGLEHQNDALLFQIRPDPALNWFTGAEGVIQVYVSLEDLKAGNLETAQVIVEFE